MANLVKSLFTYASTEIRKKINLKKDFTGAGISAHDPDYMYDIYTREFSGVKSKNMLNYIDWARRGVPFYFYKYFDTISRRDTRIRTMLRKLKIAILTEQYRVSGEWEEGVKFIESMIENLGPKLYRFFEDSTEANTKGIKRFEINYEIKNGYWMPSEIRAIPNFIYMYNEKSREYSFLDVNSINQTELISRLSGQPDKINLSQFPTVEIHPLKILDVIAIDGDEENAFMNGITIALMFSYYCKSYNVKDMNIFLERYASPTMKMKYDPLNEKSKGEMIKASQDMKAHGVIVYPDGCEPELMSDTQKGQAGNLYLNAINYWNSEITILCVGEEETTQMGNKGSLAALQVKQKISELIIEMNLRTCADSMNDLIKRLIDINFANPPEYPKFEYIKIASLEEKKTQSEINKNLKEIGVRPTIEELQEQFDVDLEEYSSPEPPEDDSGEDDPEKDPKKKDPEKKSDPGSEDDEDEEFELDFITQLFEQAEQEVTAQWHT